MITIELIALIAILKGRNLSMTTYILRKKALRFRFIAIFAILLIAAVSLFCSPSARAQNPSDTAYNAWISNFLVQSGGQTYFASTLTGSGRNSAAYMWGSALDTLIVMDTYDRTHNPALVTLVNSLLNSFVYYNGSDWSWDTWNDDVGWATIAFVRGYQMTGNSAFLTDAANNWNMAYNRGWDNTFGGGVWEEQSGKHSKAALSNDSLIIAGCALYEVTGDSNYLTKCQNMYSWVRANLFNSTNANNSLGAPGQVNEAIATDNGQTLQSSDNVYNSGSFLESAEYLYRLTGTAQYYNDAVLAANHVVNNNTILHNSAEYGGNQWAYWFCKGLSDLCSDNNLWPTYYNWMLSNAQAAWNTRNPSTNLTWNDWTTVSNEDQTKTEALECSSGVAIWQFLALPPQFMLINKNSGKALDLIGGNITNGAVINQWSADSGSRNQRWLIVPNEAGNHFKLLSAITRKSACIDLDSTSTGAQLHDWAYTGNNPAQQFDLVDAGNGWCKLKNVHSGLILEVASSSTADNAKVQQNTDAGAANQLWRLQPIGNYYIRASSGRYICIQGAGSSDGSAIIQYDWQTNPWFKWQFTSEGNGWYGLFSLNATTKVACIDGPNSNLGDDIHLWTYNPSNAGDQKLRIAPQVNGNFKFYWNYDGLTWDIPGGQTANNIPLEQYTDVNNAWQQFLLERAP